MNVLDCDILDPGALSGKLKSTTTYTSDALHQTTFYAYDSAGNVVLTWTPKTWSTSDGTGVDGWTTSATSYDLDGRTTDTYTGTYLGTGTPDFTVTQATSSSPSGVTIDEPLYDDATQAQASGDAVPVHTSHTDYTPDGQVADSTDQYGNTTTNHYDAAGNLIETINGDGTVVRTTYDALGRAVLTTDPFVPGQSDPVLATSSIYDSLGHVIESDRLSGVSFTVAPDTRYTDVYTITANTSGAQLVSSTRTGRKVIRGKLRAGAKSNGPTNR